MNVPTEDILRKAVQWARYADEDLRLADPPTRLVACHAQQCAEKYLKSYLVLRCVDFPYTHNISRLLELYFGRGRDRDYPIGVKIRIAHISNLCYYSSHGYD